jgi:hypothetical protein
MRVYYQYVATNVEGMRLYLEYLGLPSFRALLWDHASMVVSALD